jgi:hypothetical protein
MKQFVLVLMLMSAAVGQGKQGPSLADTDTWLTQTLSFSNSQNSDAWMVEEELSSQDGANYEMIATGCKAEIGRWPTRNSYPPHYAIYRFEKYDFEFGALDPASVISKVLPNPESWRHQEPTAALIVLRTKNDAETITEHSFWRAKESTKDAPFEDTSHPRNHVQMYIGAEYAPRVVKALRHAIELCGGTPSTF